MLTTKSYVLYQLLSISFHFTNQEQGDCLEVERGYYQNCFTLPMYYLFNG